MLRVRAYRPTFTPVSHRQLEAVGEGIRASGDDFAFAADLDEDADVALVVSAPKFPGTKLFETRSHIHDKFKGRMVTSESCLFRRNRVPHEGDDPYFRLSVGGFMRDDGIYHPTDFMAPCDRWYRLASEQHLKIKPWRILCERTYILVCLQKPSDASLRGLDVRQWVEKIVEEIRSRTDARIRLRAHPLDKEKAGVEIPESWNAVWSDEEGIIEDLDWAMSCVTYTSLSAIEAVMEGVPTFCMDRGNHAYPMSLGENLERLTEDEIRCEIDRLPCLHRLAYCQWKLSEFREGTPWARLRGLLKV